MPPIAPILPPGDSTSLGGPFEITVTAQFDDLLTGYWQRLFDFGNGPASNNILLTQVDNTNDIMFAIYQDGQNHHVIAENAIVEGEVATWTVGVDETGMMRIEKDGTLLAEAPGIVPDDAVRDNLLIGSSNWSGDAPLVGEVIDLTITPDPVSDISGPAPDPAPDPVPDPDLPADLPPPPPADPVDPTALPHLGGAFVIDVAVRFDDLQGGYWQRVFDFGDGPASNNILFGQVENTSDIMLEVWQDGTAHRVIAENAIVQGETAAWSVGIDADGLMWIEKDGVRLAEATGVVPDDEVRTNMLIGSSNWSGDTPLLGEVVDLTLSPIDAAPDPDPIAPTDPADPIDQMDPPLPDPGDPDPVDPGPVDPGPVDPDPTPPLAPGGDLGGDLGGDMVVVAHPDDDLLFINPTIDLLIDGADPLTTVYLSSGDAGLGPDYWAEREEGIRDAYSHMAGANDWVNEIVTLSVGDTTFDINSSYLASDPDVRLYFMRLPDGFSQGTGSESQNGQSLQHLWEGTQPEIAAVDGSASYTAQELSQTLTALMDLHNPAHIHVQDHESEIEHSDHVHASYFTMSALGDYDAPYTLTSYVGYESWGLEENFTPAQQELVGQTFAEYAAHDPNVWGSDGAYLEAYDEWVLREYVADHHAAGTFDPLAYYINLSLPPDPLTPLAEEEPDPDLLIL